MGQTGWKLPNVSFNAYNIVYDFSFVMIINALIIYKKKKS